MSKLEQTSNAVPQSDVIELDARMTQRLVVGDTNTCRESWCRVDVSCARPFARPDTRDALWKFSPVAT